MPCRLPPVSFFFPSCPCGARTMRNSCVGRAVSARPRGVWGWFVFCDKIAFMNETKNIILYESTDGALKLEVPIDGDTVWLNAQQMSDLFCIDRSGIVKHVQNIIETNELEEKSTCAKIAQVAKDGKKRLIDHYNLDMIISVGYRVNSLRGTQFRILATNRLREYI